MFDSRGGRLYLPVMPSDSPAIRLAVALARQDLTVRALAEKMGVRHEAISRLSKHGMTQGKTVTWETVAEALGVPVEALRVGGPWGPLVE